MTSKKYIGFTFIEVVVSITIIALFSIVGISSFERFFKNSQMLSIKTKVANIIKNENDSIVSGNISSYRITFFTGSNAILINENFFKNPHLISLNSFDINTLSGILETNNSSTGSWNTKTYIDNILADTYMFSGSGEKIGLNFGAIRDFEKISINSTIDSKDTNRIIIKRIDYSGRDSGNIEDTVINTLSGSSLYDKVVIENIIGNKKIFTSIGTNPEVEYNGDININLIRGNQDITFKLEK